MRYLLCGACCLGFLPPPPPKAVFLGLSKIAPYKKDLYNIKRKHLEFKNHNNPYIILIHAVFKFFSFKFALYLKFQFSYQKIKGSYNIFMTYLSGEC